jgi:hypothetical protein
LAGDVVGAHRRVGVDRVTAHVPVLLRYLLQRRLQSLDLVLGGIELSLRSASIVTNFTLESLNLVAQHLGRNPSLSTLLLRSLKRTLEHGLVLL